MNDSVPHIEAATCLSNSALSLVVRLGAAAFAATAASARTSAGGRKRREALDEVDYGRPDGGHRAHAPLLGERTGK